MSDRAQAIPAAPPQRPGIGSRTSSAPSGGLHKLDPGRRSGPNVGHTLMEEEEGPSNGSRIAPKRSRSRQPGDEVRSICTHVLPVVIHSPVDAAAAYNEIV